MLVLTRKEGEQIRIGDDIVVTVVRTGGDKIRLGIEAPSDKVILRSELKSVELPEQKIRNQEDAVSFGGVEHFAGFEVAKCS